MKKERITLAEIYKEEGRIYLQFPNEKDVLTYELYGFLKIYLEKLEESLYISMEKTR